MPNTNSNPLDSLFDSIKCTLHQYKIAREGKLLVDCKRPSDGGALGFKILVSGFDSSCYCSREDLSDYMSRQDSRTILNENEDERLVEQGILDILLTTGHGSIVAAFDKYKCRKSEFICQVTVSYRSVISF
jgi:hypothetical protein